ncbi:MAG TPA: methylated-DNA--[protein]-cysteine S-methyltransferase [Clostridia bacterium]|nr:methylated-DNA--[protein]-cysteine S-methyltransferase [Clostridia bacterium]
MGNVFYYDTPIGRLMIGGQDDNITYLLFEGNPVPRGYSIGETPILAEAARQLDEYFCGRRKEFDLRLEPMGTEFMNKVWTSLLKIPYGQTRSYKDIAESIGKNKAYRAVGLANNRNPISIIIPCHRVVGSNGALVGYGGGLEIKTFLLNLEQENSSL